MDADTITRSTCRQSNELPAMQSEVPPRALERLVASLPLLLVFLATSSLAREPGAVGDLFLTTGDVVWDGVGQYDGRDGAWRSRSRSTHPTAGAATSTTSRRHCSMRSSTAVRSTTTRRLSGS